MAAALVAAVRIIHVVTALDPAGGGPPQVAIRLAAAQAARGHEVHVVCYASTADQGRVAAQIEHVPHRDRVRLHPVLDPGRAELVSGGRARRALGELTPRSDFVHIHGVWGAILRAAADTARGSGVPYCFRPAGMLDPWSLAQKRWKKKLALAFGYRSVMNGASFIHALNDDEKRLLAPLLLRAPVVVVPNGVFMDELVPLPPAGTFRAARPDLGGAPFVLFLSRLHHKKGLDVLAEAFILLARRRDDVRLVVAGPDEGEQRGFAERIAAGGMKHRVHLVGPLYGREKLAALVDAACFCLPSRQEGFSVAITEALACGVPVVISEACHFPEVAATGAGVITPLDPTAIAAALAGVLADPSTAARMGAAGAALVRARFTWEAVAERTLALYDDVARGALPR